MQQQIAQTDWIRLCFEDSVIRWSLTPYGPDEELQMIQKFIKDIDALELDTDLQNYAKGNHSQAETVDYLTEKLGSLLLQENFLTDMRKGSTSKIRKFQN